MKRSSFSKLRWLLRNRLAILLSRGQIENLKRALLRLVILYQVLILLRVRLSLGIIGMVDSYDPSSGHRSWLASWYRTCHGTGYDKWVILSTPSKRNLLADPELEITRISLVIGGGFLAEVPLNLIELNCNAHTVFSIFTIQLLVGVVLRVPVLDRVVQDPSKDGGKGETFLDAFAKTYLSNRVHRASGGLTTRSAPEPVFTSWVWIFFISIVSASITYLAVELS